ncbi:restriction endonuclease subunit S [Corallococcus sp. AB018]|uniref:restriction endonuclease subunit S n=1 Tax=Corallococcus sp. AB018 TaxID=2316715 RepID=UPI000F87C046|nr:restriction endonuclease subunit S [Corallococcus sp. AB018]RUO93223.1 restriction endonuclease subunit S [Corallococcus sp. AB018]
MKLNAALKSYGKRSPGDWSDSMLGHHLRTPIRNGYSPVCPTASTGVWMLSLSAVTEDGFNVAGVKPAPLNDDRVLDNLLVPGDIVVSRSNTPERVGLAGLYRGEPEPCAYPDLMMRVRPSSSLNSEYLLLHLLSHRGRKYFSESARGSSSSMVKIDRAILESFPVPVPPLSEQRAIAAAISDVDALLGSLDRLITKKRDLKQAAMQQLLTGRTRLPEFSGRWETMKLGSLGSFSKGKGIRKDEVLTEGMPCVRYGEIYTQHNDVIRSFYSFVSREVAKRSRRLRTGDLIFAASGETAEEIGKCVAFLGHEEAYVGGDTVLLSPSGHDPQFLGYLLNQPSVVVQKARMGQGDAVVHISARNLASLTVSIPRQDEQKAIAAVLSDIDAEIDVLNQRREKTRLLKQGMMQELLTGRTRLV